MVMADGFVPRKRFRRNKMAILDGFVPRKRFMWDKMPQTRLLATPKTSIWSEQRDSSPVLSGFLLHSIRLIFIQGETLGFADPLLLLQLDIFLGLLERDIAGNI